MTNFTKAKVSSVKGIADAYVHKSAVKPTVIVETFVKTYAISWDSEIRTLSIDTVAANVLSVTFREDGLVLSAIVGPKYYATQINTKENPVKFLLGPLLFLIYYDKERGVDVVLSDNCNGKCGATVSFVVA